MPVRCWLARPDPAGCAPASPHAMSTLLMHVAAGIPLAVREEGRPRRCELCCAAIPRRGIVRPCTSPRFASRLIILHGVSVRMSSWCSSRHSEPQSPNTRATAFSKSDHPPTPGPEDTVDIIDEALDLFKANVFFKNYEVKVRRIGDGRVGF